jgi:hypothetical protein
MSQMDLRDKVSELVNAELDQASNVQKQAINQIKMTFRRRNFKQY